MKKPKPKLHMGRIIGLVLAVTLEAAALLAILIEFKSYLVYGVAPIRIMSILVVLFILAKSKHLSFDKIWIIFILFFPVVGTAIYILIGADIFKSRTYRKIVNATKDCLKYRRVTDGLLEEMSEIAPERKGQFNYIENETLYPFYRCKEFDYYPFGENGYVHMLEDLKKAENFIFLEYFIIQKGKMWDGIVDILAEKAAEGVEVRVIYDDMGSIATLKAGFKKEIEKLGIKCHPFNKVSPFLGAIMNHRDHRKILVIDGKTAYSGGINLADEYINELKLFGRWKDNVIRMKGECIRSMTVMFLSHWNAAGQEDDDYSKFLDIESDSKMAEDEFDGYIAPYGETPLDDELTSQNIYLNILNQAKDYCYIFTPYLLIDTEMINALILAAKRGVDVRIITPGIPDKKMIYKMTRSFYNVLIEGGVKIFEYTPGFVHAKVFVSDDDIATVGTINLDYRSLYLHFENGTYLYKTSKIMDVKQDLLDSFALSHEVTLEESHYGFFKQLFLSVLLLFAPLM